MSCLRMEKVVTALRVQKRNPNRVNVYLDGEFALGLSRMSAAWLTVGRKLSETEIAKLLGDDELEVAYQKALHFLSYRPRSSQEVIKKLTDKGFSKQVIETTMERLQGEGFINDNSFAEQWIDNRNTFRPRSRRMLGYELRQKGIPDESIQEALESIEISEEELAYKAGLKKAQACQNLDWQSFRNKVGSFLARRGFAYNIAAPVLKRLWNDTRPASKGDQLNENNGVR